MAWLAKVGEVVSKQFHEDYVEIHARLPVRHAGKLARGNHQIEVLAGHLPETKPESESWEEKLPTAGRFLLESTEQASAIPDEEVA